MSGNTFGKLFTVTTYGESHGLGLGAIIDGCPPGLSLTEEDLQIDLDRRKPGQNRYTTARREDDEVTIMSGVFEGKTTGTPIGLTIKNKDQRSKDYGNIATSNKEGLRNLLTNHYLRLAQIAEGNGKIFVAGQLLERASRLNNLNEVQEEKKDGRRVHMSYTRNPESLKKKEA